MMLEIVPILGGQDGEDQMVGCFVETGRLGHPPGVQLGQEGTVLRVDPRYQRQIGQIP